MIETYKTTATFLHYYVVDQPRQWGCISYLYF